MKKPTNILVLTYWNLADALVQTYTLPYLRIIGNQLAPGSVITLFTLEKNPSMLREENTWTNALRIEGIQWVSEPYYAFGLSALLRMPSMLLRLRSLIRREKIGYIHCWATPAGALGYLLSIWTGVPLIIDSYEPHAEAMVENGTWKRNGLAFRLLFSLEKLQSQKATALIAANGGMKQYAMEKYGLKAPNFFIKPACVDLQRFDSSATPDEQLRDDLGLRGKRVAVYAGKFGGIYLDQEVFSFFKAVSNRWGDQFRALLLTGHTSEEIEQYCSRAGLDSHILVTRFVPHAEVARYLALADFALTPVKPVPTKRYCTPIKDGEYWAMGLPVVIPVGISEDSEIILRERIGAVLERQDHEAYATALDTLESLFAEPKDELRKRIRQVAIRYRNFTIAEGVYRQVYGK